MDESHHRQEVAETTAVENSPWNPGLKDFRPYSPSSSNSTKSLSKPTSLHVIVRRPLVARLTKDIVETYQLCNPEFKYSEALNPKRFLTNPSVGLLNDGYDNENSDLILSVNFVLVNVGSQQRYVVKDILGQGTFGQVAKCWVSESKSFVAVKIIKNQPAFYQQALVEVSILQMLNQQFDPEDKHHIVRILNHFVYQRHLCISFEMLSSNLYELIRMNQFRGLSLSIVQLFSKQILTALVVMKDAGIIHCDLKPENILLSTSVTPPEVKIIDFGSACMEDRTVYSYIQSRYYRSPEVLLGYPYTTAIDMWSFGCIIAELFLGLPLFPGFSEFDLLKRMIEILGGQPPDNILMMAKNTNKFFKRVGNIHCFEDDVACKGSRSAYQVLTEEEFEARELRKPVIGKRYFNFVKLEEIVANYPHRKNLSDEEISKENLTRLALIDFLRGLLGFDPQKRWSPLQAVRHPFLTGEPFACPYRPPPETPRIPVGQNVTVDHNPGGGHWFAAGLSPQVSTRNNGPPQSSPHFQGAPFSHASSYGSLGSHGSYNDGAGLGSSYGSYGDNNCMYTYYSSVCPSGLNIQSQGGGSILGASPDARWRTSQVPHGNGFGLSPSTGTFGPMSLGASPSQFTPPSSQLQVSAGSPGKYGPPSPARNSVHGSPLGKVAAAGQYNRRRSWGYPGTLYMQPQENASSQNWQGHPNDGISSSHPDGNSQGLVGSPRSMQSASNHSIRRQHWGGNGFVSGFSSTIHQNVPVPFSHSSHVLPPSEASYDKQEYSSSPPDPGDWDPNYSDDLLLQEDGSEVSSLISGVTNGMRLGHSSDSSNLTGGIDRFTRGCNEAQTSSNVFTHKRRNGPVHAYSHTEGSPLSVHDAHTGYAHPMSKPPHHMPQHFSQNSPSRFGQQPGFGQQPVQRFNQMQSTFIRGERNYPKGQATPSSCNTAGPHSPGRSTFASGTPWGRRTGHPITTIPPTSHARKDYGKIT